MELGKHKRLSRLFGVSGRSIIVPMDHGATLGPVHGLRDALGAFRRIARCDSAVQAVVLQRGFAARVAEDLKDSGLSLILQLSASTSLGPDPAHKQLVATVEDAVALGADGVSVHVNLGSASEGAMVRDLGRTASQCQRWGMPLLAMVYTSAMPQGDDACTAAVAQAARVVAELGADLVKVRYPGSVAAMQQVADGCFAPVLVAGGERTAQPEVLVRLVADAIEGGASGVCIGRNVFQSSAVETVLGSIARVVHGAGEFVSPPFMSPARGSRQPGALNVVS